MLNNTQKKNKHMKFKVKLSLTLIIFIGCFLLLVEYYYYYGCKTSINYNNNNINHIVNDSPCNEKNNIYSEHLDCNQLKKELTDDYINERIMSCVVNKNLSVNLSQIVGFFSLILFFYIGSILIYFVVSNLFKRFLNDLINKFNYNDNEEEEEEEEERQEEYNNKQYSISSSNHYNKKEKNTKFGISNGLLKLFDAYNYLYK